MKHTKELKAGRHLVIQVRGGLIAKGSSLSRWCAENGVCRPWAYEALMGRRNGDKACALRQQLAEMTGAVNRRAA